MQNLLDDLIDALKADERLIINGKLAKNKIVEFALAMDEKLIAMLLATKSIKKQFFKDIGGVLVFDKVAFQSFVSNKQFLPDSYTAFKNKIGLTANNEYLTESNEVVLSWPYKDCVLEGGQTKEDQKRKEIFWNETLAPDEVDRLLEPKVLTNFKKYDKDGEHDVEGVDIDDNLIIKGNNLLALHSLKRKYAGKVKLIYIDPPYNTGSDSFGYNDSFKRATWLTFVKNRLIVAKKLLSTSGVLIIQCSFHQFAYLRVMMDEVFPKHLCDLNIQVRHPDRSLTGDKEFNDIIEYALVYSNDLGGKMPIKEIEKTIDDYCLEVIISEDVKPETIKCGNKDVEVFTPDMYKVVSKKPNNKLLKKISIRGSIREKNSSGRFFVKHLEGKLDYPAETLFKVPDMGDDSLNFRYFYSAPVGRKNGGYFQGMPLSSSITKKQYPNFYNFEKEYNNVSKQGRVEFRNGKKPEELIQLFVEMFTQKGDLVLDYHLGSGTTAAVALKMHRNFIGIEQMEKQINLSVERLSNVQNKEYTGISKIVNWQGGGLFTYCELMQNNADIIDQIEESETTKDLLLIWQSIKDSDFISYKVKPSSISENADEFESLSIDEQKQFLIAVLDKNQLYVNYSEIDDEDYQISNNDKDINQQFYG